MNWISNYKFFFVSINICLFINEFTLVYFTSDGTVKGNALFLIRFFNILTLLIGFSVSKGYIGAQVILFTIACLIPLFLFEIALRATTFFDQLERSFPSYIPPYLKVLDSKIDTYGGYRTKEGFRTWNSNITNMISSLKSDKGCTIVALGDSMVWGDGLPASETWPAKLNTLTNCNVYPIGKNGWSSLEQFEFYQNNLAELDIDFIIVGIVPNDPHPRGNYCGQKYSKDIYVRRYFSVLKSIGPLSPIVGKTSYAISYIDQVIEGIFTPFIQSSGSLEKPPITTWGYENWERRLYADDIFTNWSEAVKCFYISSRHPVGFLLTPTTVSDSQEKYYSQIENTLSNLDITYLNLYQETKDLLGSYRRRDDWANPADAHPGSRQTSLYANKALLLLQTIGF